MAKLIRILILAGWLVLLFLPQSSMPQLGRFFYLGSSLLKIDNSAEQSRTFTSEPYGEISIGIDSLGVPHIYAPNMPAASYATGYMHAKDRLFQLELMMRVAKGRLSEVVGKDALKSDMFWRKFRFEEQSIRLAEELRQIAPEQYEILEAYAEGVNKYIEKLNINELPLEFHLLGFSPSEFSPSDMYLLVRYMDYTLNYDEDDAAFSNLYASMPEEKVDFLYPAAPDSIQAVHPYVAQHSFEHNFESPELYKAYMQGYKTRTEEEKTIGSNNWAVSGQKTNSGAAILCNDTHLSLTLPSTWYEVQIQTPEHRVHGLTIPGAPYIISGFNDDLAWGITNATWDLVNLYHLEFNETGQYLLDGQWVSPEKRSETFAVKGSEDIIHEFHYTHFGVMDSISGQWLAVDWIAQQNSQEPLAFGGLMEGKSIEEARSVLKHFIHPPQNFALADSQGEVALITSGSALLRPKEQKRGIQQVNKKVHKQPFIPMHEVLSTFKPDQNYVASANQNQLSIPEGAALSTRYAAMARANRINSQLRGMQEIDEADMRRLQFDHYDEEWDRIRDITYQGLPEDLSETMNAFDGNLHTDSWGATLFTAFKLELLRLCNENFANRQRFTPNRDRIWHLLQHPELLAQVTDKSSLELSSEAWRRTLAKLETKLGKNRDDWNYGNYHKTHINHIARIAPLNHPPFASVGGPTTVNVSSGTNGVHGPSMRTIISLNSESPKADMAIYGGQSGRFNSPNYEDQIESFSRGEYHSVVFKTSFDASDYVQTIQINQN